MTDFGDELHRLLEERGMSLSAAAREAGCSKGYLSNAANGRKPLTPRVAAGLDRLFGTRDTFVAHALNPEREASSPAAKPGSARPANTRRSDRPHRDDGQRAGDAAGVRPQSPPLPIWAATAAGAKRDANRIWDYDLDQSGTPAGTATSAASVILSWLTALPDGTAENAAGDTEIFRHDVKRVRAVRAWLKISITRMAAGWRSLWPPRTCVTRAQRCCAAPTTR